MKTTNILIAGVGGQGLVLATRIISMTAFAEGYDVKSGDVIGLSQRGGNVWGSVRFGAEVFSPMIPNGEGDILLALEELEALRWLHLMRSSATIILNKKNIYPNRVLIEKEKYPAAIADQLTAGGYNVIPVDGKALARESGNEKTENIALLGRLSLHTPFKYETWVEIIKKNVPAKTIDANIKAFDFARE